MSRKKQNFNITSKREIEPLFWAAQNHPHCDDVERGLCHVIIDGEYILREKFDLKHLAAYDKLFCESNNKINMKTENGAYDLEGVIFHQHSNKLMVEILKLWPDKNIPVIDLGCGHNFYINVLRYAGYVDVLGVDNVPLRSVDVIMDITKPIHHPSVDGIRVKLRRVISLEVGEHVPANLSDAYLDNLTSFGGDIIMSWAIPGQSGVGHINCQTNGWVVEQMAKREYEINYEKTKQLRVAVNGCHCSWLINTLMYFELKPF
jgi:hypothetical protein